jgi:hypothetical protein
MGSKLNFDLKDFKTDYHIHLVEQFDKIASLYPGQEYLIRCHRGIDIGNFIKSQFKRYSLCSENERMFLSFNLIDEPDPVYHVKKGLEGDFHDELVNICIHFEQIHMLSLSNQRLLYNALKDRDSFLFTTYLKKKNRSDTSYYIPHFLFFTTEIDLRDRCISGTFLWELYILINKCEFEIKGLSERNILESKNILFQMISYYAHEFGVN